MRYADRNKASPARANLFTRLLFLVLIIFSYAIFTMPAHASDVSIDDLRWNYRLIVAFQPDNDADQTALSTWVAQNSCQLTERHTLVISLRNDKPTLLTETPISIDPDSLATLARSRAFADSEFEMLLIGKDGGIKARSTSVDELDSFIELIDGMPMRQREAAESSRNC
jgi:hypothetical protein